MALELEQVKAELIGNVQVVVKEVDLPARELVALAQGIAKEHGISLLISKGELRVVAGSADKRVNAGEIVSRVCEVLGGKGGGKPGFAQGVGQNHDQVEKSLKAGKEVIINALHG